MATPSSDASDSPFIDAAIDEYTYRLREVLQALASTRKQIRDLTLVQDRMRQKLADVGAVLSKQPPTEGLERGLNRLVWFLRSTEEAERALDALLESHADSTPTLVAQERIATNVLSALLATLGDAAEESSPLQPPTSRERERTRDDRRVLYVVGA